jgi:peptide/nickel transport system permease protein
MRLLSFLARRLVQLVGVLFGICLVTFLLLQLAPGDPARLLVGEKAGPEALAAVRERYGLDQPLWRQFASYLLNLLGGDIGLSIRFQRPVSQLIQSFMWPTLFLTCYVICLAVPPSVALAIVGARRPGGTADQIIRVIGVAGLTIRFSGSAS